MVNYGSLTAKGKRVVEAAMEAMGRLEKELLAGFDRSERDRLSGLTDKLMATLDPESFKIGSNG